jgi:hypothetical protein
MRVRVCPPFAQHTTLPGLIGSSLLATRDPMVPSFHALATADTDAVAMLLAVATQWIGAEPNGME